MNAANSSLLGGSGVDGAIHRVGGAQILAACRELRRTRYPEGLPTGEAVITTGGLLPARYVIHTVGPIWGQHRGRESDLLAACYRNSLALAVEHELASVAFPAISTGAYGYPQAEAAEAASQAINDFLSSAQSGNSHDDRPHLLAEVRLVFIGEQSAKAFLENHKFA